MARSISAAESSQNRQSSLSKFDFNKPFAVRFAAMGCGIGCPIYQLVIQGDFSATYKGIAFVKEKSETQFLLMSNHRLALKEFLSSETFTNLELYPPTCKYLPTDNVRYRVTVIQANQEFNTIIEQGCQDAALKPLEKLLDDIVGRWKGRYNKAVR